CPPLRQPREGAGHPRCWLERGDQKPQSTPSFLNCADPDCADSENLRDVSWMFFQPRIGLRVSLLYARQIVPPRQALTFPTTVHPSAQQALAPGWLVSGRL